MRRCSINLDEMRQDGILYDNRKKGDEMRKTEMKQDRLRGNEIKLTRQDRMREDERR